MESDGRAAILAVGLAVVAALGVALLAVGGARGMAAAATAGCTLVIGVLVAIGLLTTREYHRR